MEHGRGFWDNLEVPGEPGGAWESPGAAVRELGRLSDDPGGFPGVPGITWIHFQVSLLTWEDPASPWMTRLVSMIPERLRAAAALASVVFLACAAGSGVSTGRRRM